MLITKQQNSNLNSSDLKNYLFKAFEKLGPKKKILVIPPDYTRYHSHAGEITQYAWEYYNNKIEDILPAIGTHSPMTEQEISHMFPGVPYDLFRVHDWRNGIETIGEVPGSYLNKISGGLVNYNWPVQVDNLLTRNNYDLILSIGQVVPHEVIGMANYNKNILIGTGGSEGINKSHFLGAVYGIEKILGRIENPVRSLLNYASDNFISELPILYILTVVGMNDDKSLSVKGLYIGDDIECFKQAAELSLKTNFTMIEKPLNKIVVYLDPKEYKSTWLGNKAIYRTRMALADDGELIIIAPGVKEFGEDKEIDRLIRKYGYVGSKKVLDDVEQKEELKTNLSAAAHLIHGSSEGRFNITYCTGGLSREEIEKVNFKYHDPEDAVKKYNPGKLKYGFNTIAGGEEVFFIPNPGIGLWAHKGRFKDAK